MRPGARGSILLLLRRPCRVNRSQLSCPWGRRREKLENGVGEIAAQSRVLPRALPRRLPAGAASGARREPSSVGKNSSIPPAEADLPWTGGPALRDTLCSIVAFDCLANLCSIIATSQTKKLIMGV